MEIDDWRKRIDELTDTIISLLTQRAVYAAEIGKLKKEKGLPVFDAARPAKTSPAFPGRMVAVVAVPRAFGGLRIPTASIPRLRKCSR